MNENIKNRIDKIISSTREAISRVQYSYTPILIPISKNNVLKNYTYKGTLYELSNSVSILFDNCICRNLHRKGLTNDSFENLYSLGFIYPILLFINGVFIPWSRINVIADYHYTYFLVDIDYEMIEDVKIIIPGSGIDYYEGKEIEDTGKQLRFNSLGLFDKTSNDIVIDFVFSDLYMEFFEGKEIKSSIEGIKITNNNFIFFKEGKIHTTEDIERIDDITFILKEDLDTIIFYYFVDYENIEHMDKIVNKEAAREMVKSAKEDELIKNIIKPLELEYEDKEKGYLDYNGTLQNILDYDKTLLNPLIESYTQNFIYTGAQVIAYSKNNIFTINDPNYKDGTGMLMFVNGSLYSLYREINHYHSTYEIPITGIKVSDSIEFIFFKNIDKYTDYLVKFPKEGLTISSLIDPDSLTILAPWYPLETNISWDIEKEDIRDILCINSVIIIQTDHQIQFYNNLGKKVKLIKTINSDSIINKICYSSKNKELYILKDNYYIESVDLSDKRKFKQFLRFVSEEKMTSFNYFDSLDILFEGLFVTTESGYLNKIYIDNTGLGHVIRNEYIGFTNIKNIELLEDNGINSIKYFDDTFDKIIKTSDNKYIFYLKDNIIYKMNINDEIETIREDVNDFTIDYNSNVIYTEIKRDTVHIFLSDLKKDIIKLYSEYLGENNSIYNLKSSPDHLLVYNESNLRSIDIKRINSDKVWYRISYEKSGDRHYTIDERYEDTEICLFSNNTFKYYGVKIDKYDVAGIVLPEDFSYCKEWDHFMVFINGRRLDQDCYCLTTMRSTSSNPYTETSLFTTIPLEYKDVVDVFYLPRKYQDITRFVSVSPTGYITIPEKLLPYGFSENIIMIFLNGRKMNYSITKDINSYQIKIDENIDSKHNLTIVQYIFNSEYKELLNQKSEWDQIMNSLYYKEKNLLMDGKNISIGNEPSYKEYATSLKTPVYEVLYNYYLSDPSKAGNIFLYDLISADFEFDLEGVMVPGVFDATLIDKLKPRKPYDPLV